MLQMKDYIMCGYIILSLLNKYEKNLKKLVILSKFFMAICATTKIVTLL